MVFAASSVLVKCRLCASWEPGGGGERAGWAGVCFLDACLLGVCWWAECSGELLGGRGGGVGQTGFCWTKGSMQGEANLMCLDEHVPGCPPAGSLWQPPSRWPWWQHAESNAVFLFVISVPHEPWQPPPHLRLVLRSSQDQSYLTTCVQKAPVCCLPVHFCSRDMLGACTGSGVSLHQAAFVCMVGLQPSLFRRSKDNLLRT